jgi:phosphoglycolate phosphatase
MIGDTVMDIGMARNAVVDSIGVTWGMGSAEELLAAGATLVVSNPADLLAGVIRKYQAINTKLQHTDFVNKPARP